MSWHKRRLGDCCKLLSGGTPKKSKGEFWEGDIPWVSSGEMSESFIFDTSLHVTAEGAKNGTRLVPRGTVLIVVRGMSLAKDFRISFTMKEMTFNQDIKALECAEDVDPKYLFYALKAQKERIRDLSTDASHGTKKLDTDALVAVELDFPASLEDQNRLARFASAYDDMIENNRRRIALLEQAAQLLYREWFVHFRFPGHETLNFVDGLPEGWERKKLGEVCTSNKRSHKKGKLPRPVRYVDIGSVSTGHIDEVTEYEPEDAPGRARRIAEPMDTIWSNVRPNLRAYSLVMSPRENDVFSTGFTVLHAETVSPFFLYCTVTTEEFVRHLMNHATGASYPAVRSDDFERADVILPTSSLMDDFHSHAQPIFRQRQKLSDQNIVLSKARDLLLPRLMGGRISVDL